MKYGDLDVEVHFVETDDKVKIAISKLAATSNVERKGGVVLLHGNWVNNGFWLSRKGIGLAKLLSGFGYDVWMPEFRGHGKSPKGAKYYDFDAIQQIEYDIPAIFKHVKKASADSRVHVVAHSYGGVKILAALSAGLIASDQIGKICTLGSQVSYGYGFAKLPPIEWLLRIVLRLMRELPSKRLGMGPENEPAGTLLDYLRWKKLGGVWGDKNGNSYWTGLKNIKNSCLILAGKGDRSEPPKGCRMIFDALGSTDKTFIELSKANGHKMDYGHTELIISSASREEIWPMIAEWLTGVDSHHAVGGSHR